MIPLMENKMKWDRSKKKKFPSIEIEMSGACYSGYDEKPAEEEPSVPMFPVWSSKQNVNSPSPVRGVREHSFTLHSGDSGIESVQASPAQKANKTNTSSIDMYEVPGPSTSRRCSSVYLHPDRARFNHFSPIASSSRDQNANEDNDYLDVAGGNLSRASSSDASSLMSAPGAAGYGNRQASGGLWGRRRSSTWTGRYSDATEPEFADARMATRGSVGMHSLSDSLHKLTFTQSLAFPELARKLATRRRQEQLRAAINDTSQDDFEACSKFVAVAGVFLLSLMVYCVVNRYGRA